MRTRLLIVVVTAAVLVAGCSGADGEPTPPPTDPPTSVEPPSVTATAGVAPEDVVATTEVVASSDDVLVDIHPVVRTADGALLTLDFSTPADEPVSLGALFGAAGPPTVLSPGSIRLIDFGADEVYLPGTDADEKIVGPSGYVTVEPDGTRMQIAYAAPPAEVEELGLLLHGSPLVTGIPVIDADPSDLPAADAAEAIDPADAVEARVLPLGHYTRELDGAVATLSDNDVVEVSLGADVLFDSQSADLTDDADETIDAAARRLTTREPGTVEVVGHTDDLDGKIDNQQLSEDRADTVAEALAERIDTEDYPIETEGRGDGEPLLANTDDDARALNRRVILTLSAPETGVDETAPSGELPPFEDGPVATGEDGVELDASRPYLVRAPRARAIDGDLVVDLEITALDEDQDPSFGVAFLGSVWSYRGDDTRYPQHAVAGVIVLSGSTAVYPMDYQVGTAESGAELWETASDLESLGKHRGGKTRTYSIVYPWIGDVDTVTVQQSQHLGSEPFRLTDVPVESVE